MSIKLSVCVGSVAERLLSHLEEMVMVGDGGLNQKQQPLKETERQYDTETLSNTEGKVC